MNARTLWSYCLAALFLTGWSLIAIGQIAAQGNAGIGQVGGLSGQGGFGIGDIGGNTGGNNTGGNNTGGNNTGGNNTGGLNTGGTGSGGSTGGTPPDLQVGGLIDNLAGTIEPPPNDRYFGFVGQTGDRLNETGFVGGYSEFIGPTSEGSYGGGGFNDSSGNATNRAGGGAGGGRTGTGQNVNGFTVSRTQPIRTRIAPSFRSPSISPARRTQRFDRVMLRVPKLRGMAGNVNVTMNGNTAVINGVVENDQQLQLIERQLRLEPGVSRIENQARVGF